MSLYGYAISFQTVINVDYDKQQTIYIPVYVVSIIVLNTELPNNPKLSKQTPKIRIFIK